MIDVSTATEQVRALAEELGLAVDPVVLADRSNLVLHLAPAPVVARVAMATSLARVGMTWLRREIEITRFAAARGGAVTRPFERPGPYERSGLVITLWQLETLVADRADPHEAGRALAALHRGLRDYDALPVWGALDEAEQVLARARARRAFHPAELVRIERAHDRARSIVEGARARTASLQAVHGDAHIGNALATARGVLWTDWEDAFVGPVEWDLACLRSKAELFGEERESIDAMTAAYDGEWDRDLARDLGLVRNLQVVAWLAVFAERQPELLPRMRARIERLP